MSRQHLVLVPGFGGFDALGSLRYYHGVTDLLRECGLVLHYFPNLPTASVATRALQLQHWLSALWDRGAVAQEDEVHLVGHSTGGLDLRQLLSYWRQQSQQGGEHARQPILERIRSVQFLSTPHHGTTLAYHFSRARWRQLLSRGALRVAYEGARGLREGGLGLMGQGLRKLMPSSRQADWVDALVDTAASCRSSQPGLPRASSRASYFNLLRWLLHMTSDFSAINDLAPVSPPGVRGALSPAYMEETQGETEFLEENGIRARSLVTVAREPGGGLPTELYTVLYRLTAWKPPELFQPCDVEELLAPGKTRTLGPSDNDGIVNSVSMVWPHAGTCRLVDADHADVIGHFRYHPAPPREDGLPGYAQYDLLDSGSAFGEKEFTALWRDIGTFATKPQSEKRAPVRKLHAPRP